MEKKRIKSLLICNSNMFIPTVLTEVLVNQQEAFLVISDTNNITKFFEFISIPNVDFIEYGQLESRFDFIRKKRQLLKEIRRYDIGEVVFFHAEFGEMANWLIKRLSNDVPIKYCKLYDSVPCPRCRKWLTVAKIKLRQYLYWGIKMDVLEYPYPFPSIPKKFFEDVKAETITMPIDNVKVSNVVSIRMAEMELVGKFVLLTGTIVCNGFYTADIYTEYINDLIEVLGRENVISKCHPRFKDLYGLEKELPQIPSFIPGNVLINKYDYYIGFESTLLVEAAVAGKTAISLIDLLPTSDELRNNTHNFFDNRLQNRGNIFFPTSIEELKAILNL